MTKQEMLVDYQTRKRKQFFALGRELNYDSNALKERAKKFWDVESFKDLTTIQILILIEKLQDQKYRDAFEIKVN